ncbi:hypothetical protein [Phytohabitans suffuscus]|uniref:hypothetical protein n=1 Tax=Phytohabitans suffuscus TaxID=624315 RepID=UPI001E3E745C|nr:hypothetical protein [Phytohabitans suffuscus]
MADAQPLGQAVGVEVGAGREGAGQDGLDQRVADAVAGVARAGAGVARERGRLVSVTPAIL